ncbi:RICIN domain-containing protein [Streptomyces sp. NPDC091271]|uniref:RICIN domain-containing protein n=1 Tax=Streptomyces sp. NPDC091271 TaxID=3365980 RepID=UPI00382161C9
MAREEGSTQPAVRRATALPQVSGTAVGPGLTPRTPAAGRPAGEEPGGEAEGGARAVGTAPAPATVSEPETGSGPSATATTAGATTATPSAEPDHTAAVAPGSGGMTEPPAATAAAGEPPSPRPNKPLLAAAAIGGSLLIGVPLLFMGMSDDDTRTRPAAASVSSDVMPLDKGQTGRTAGSYVPASPSATPSPTGTPKKPAGPSPSAPVTQDSGKGTTSGARKQTEAKSTGKPAPSKAAVRRAAVRAGGALPTAAQFSTVTGVLIKNRMTGLCADVPNYGKGKLNGKVEQFTCDGSSRDNQLWDLVVNQKGAGPGGADLFTVRNAKDDYCLDLPDYGSRPSRTGVFEWHCNPGAGDNQMWFLDKRADGSFWIRNHKSSSLCLDVSGLGGSGGRGAHLTVFTCSAQDDHAWSFA